VCAGSSLNCCTRLVCSFWLAINWGFLGIEWFGLSKGCGVWMCGSLRSGMHIIVCFLSLTFRLFCNIPARTGIQPSGSVRVLTRSFAFSISSVHSPTSKQKREEKHFNARRVCRVACRHWSGRSPTKAAKFASIIRRFHYFLFFSNPQFAPSKRTKEGGPQRFYYSRFSAFGRSVRRLSSSCFPHPPPFPAAAAVLRCSFLFCLVGVVYCSALVWVDIRTLSRL